MFERIESEEIGQLLEEVQDAYLDFGKFCKVVKLVTMIPFKSAANALEEINCISEGTFIKKEFFIGVISPLLKEFLLMNLPGSSKKKASFELAVCDKALASSIKQDLGFDCVSDDFALEIIRGIRYHSVKLLRAISEGDLDKSQLGLGHAFSRAKVKFNVNRVDNMIIQAIAILDQMDKDINTFSMRVREWYSWHFPELSRLISDIEAYAHVVKIVQNRAELGEKDIPVLESIISKCIDKKNELDVSVDISKVARSIVDAAKTSMGADISALDLLNVKAFADRVIGLSRFRRTLQDYLHQKMTVVAPNLSALIGDAIGARLISRAGSLTNLSKYPASTVQILGAEKALFRALKTKGKTPKFGLIYHSSFIGKAGPKNKGRISRYLANKCSIASRIDCFSEEPFDAFGKALREQVESRLSFFETGVNPARNIDVMHSVIESMADASYSEISHKSKKPRQ